MRYKKLDHVKIAGWSMRELLGCYRSKRRSYTWELAVDFVDEQGAKLR